MRVIAFLVAATAAAALAGSAGAATKKNQSVVYRSAAGTVIQPTRTIIHNPDGTTTTKTTISERIELVVRTVDCTGTIHTFLESDAKEE